MSGALRQIALTVEQTGNNSYAWLLIESAGGRVFVLKKANHAQASYLSALNAGYEELALLSACGLHNGPLNGQDGQSAAPVRGIEMAELHDAL
jgi:hypothetical protein